MLDCDRASLRPSPAVDVGKRTNRAGLPQTAAAVGEITPLIFPKQMDFLHQQGAVSVRRDWRFPRTDVALDRGARLFRPTACRLQMRAPRIRRGLLKVRKLDEDDVVSEMTGRSNDSLKGWYLSGVSLKTA